MNQTLELGISTDTSQCYFYLIFFTQRKHLSHKRTTTHCHFELVHVFELHSQFIMFSFITTRL